MKILFLSFFFLINCFQKKIDFAIIHALTGSYAISVLPIVNAELLAIDDINKSGGILGYKVNPIIIDGKSDWSLFKKETEDLFQKKDIKAVIGCFASACRKEVLPIYEKYNKLLIYPAQYEGIEESNNILYSGSVPNQQLTPAIKWANDNLGKTFFIVSSDSLYQRVSNEIIKNVIKVVDGKLLGEEYLLTDSTDTDKIAEKIFKLNPSVVINNTIPITNNALITSLTKYNVLPNKSKMLLFKIAETEIVKLDKKESLIGSFAVANYFQSLEIKENLEFIKKYKAKYGEQTTISDPMISAYSGILLWAEAVKQAGTFDTDVVRKNLYGLSLSSPAGMYYIDANSLNLWNEVYIGKLNKDLQFDIIWKSEKPVKPVSYPRFKSKKEWNDFSQNYFKENGNFWTRKVQPK